MERILLAGSIVAADVMSDVGLHDEDDDDFIPLSPHSPLLCFNIITLLKVCTFMNREYSDEIKCYA